jgi:hypothetical protein
VLISILEHQLERDQSSACIIIDAVDECKRHLPETFRLLREIQRKTNVGIIITDRLTQDGLWKEYFRNAHEIELAAKEDDITLYIRRRLTRAGLKLFERKPGLLEHVKKQIMDASGGKSVLRERKLLSRR